MSDTTAEGQFQLVRYRGVLVEDMTRQELIEAVKWLGDAYNRTLKLYAAELPNLHLPPAK